LLINLKKLSADRILEGSHVEGARRSCAVLLPPARWDIDISDRSVRGPSPGGQLARKSHRCGDRRDPWRARTPPQVRIRMVRRYGVL